MGVNVKLNRISFNYICAQQNYNVILELMFYLFIHEVDNWIDNWIGFIINYTNLLFGEINVFVFVFIVSEYIKILLNKLFYCF